jgi:hypothetical protein
MYADPICKSGSDMQRVCGTEAGFATIDIAALEVRRCPSMDKRIRLGYEWITGRAVGWMFDRYGFNSEITITIFVLRSSHDRHTVNL